MDFLIQYVSQPANFSTREISDLLSFVETQSQNGPNVIAESLGASRRIEIYPFGVDQKKGITTKYADKKVTRFQRVTPSIFDTLESIENRYEREFQSDDWEEFEVSDLLYVLRQALQNRAEKRERAERRAQQQEAQKRAVIQTARETKDGRTVYKLA